MSQRLSVGSEFKNQEGEIVVSGMVNSESPDSENDETIVFDISYACLRLFEGFQMSIDRRRLETYETEEEVKHLTLAGLHNTFAMWADYTGALSRQESSLDVRLRGLPDVCSMVMELLEMVLRNLRRLNDDEPSLDRVNEWDDSLKAVDEALDRLNFLAIAIRKASAKRMRYDAGTFLRDEDTPFHRDMVAYVRWKYPRARKALCDQLGVSIAVRRRILQQKCRHAQNLARRRLPFNFDPVLPIQESGTHVVGAQQLQEAPTNSLGAAGPNVPFSTATQASKPTDQKKVFAYLNPQSKATLSSTRGSTTMNTAGDRFAYPEPPKLRGDGKHTPCPYCLSPLETARLGDTKEIYWNEHIDQDLEPYVCLFPECAKDHVFFIRQKEWKKHMEEVHPGDWLREVHTLTYYCDLGHEVPYQFDTEEEWNQHMKNLDFHPSRFTRPPTKVQLATLAQRKQETVLREEYHCPLCESIPKGIGTLLRKLKPEDLNDKLIRHVAGHIKSLAFMSLPGLDLGLAEQDGVSSIDEHQSLKRQLGEGSVQESPSEPSGIERMSVVSLYFTEDNQPPPVFLDKLIHENQLNISTDFDPPDPNGEFIVTSHDGRLQMLSHNWEEILNQKPTHSTNDPILISLQRQKQATSILAAQEMFKLNQSAPLDPVRIIPYPRNENYIRRSDLVNKLDAFLSQPGFNTAALWGLRGSGKTQIALDYVYRRCDGRSSIFWVNAESEATFVKDYNLIATKIGVDGKLDGADMLRAVREGIEATKDWVLVLDNAADPTLFRTAAQSKNLISYVPQGSTGTVLWTSPDSKITSLVNSILGIHVPPMTPAEMKELLETTGLEHHSHSLSTEDYRIETNLSGPQQETAGERAQDTVAIIPKHSQRQSFQTESHLPNHGVIYIYDGGNELISRELWMGRSATGNATAIRPSTYVAAAIRDALKKAGVPSSRRNKFVPVSKLGDIISQPNILQLIQVLKSCSDMSPSEKEQLANKICFVSDRPHCSSYRKIVAALIKIEREEDIRSVVEEGFSDDYVTLKSTDDYTLRDGTTGRICQTMKNWDSETRVKYWRSMDKYNVPVFMRPSKRGVYHYVLDKRMILPFERIPSVYGITRDPINQVGLGANADDNEGGFSTVKRVKIHADHHRFGNYGVSPNVEFFAIKSLHTRQRTNFEEEVMVLLRFTHRTDKQLVKLLATYELWDGDDVSYHLIFPWADWSLKTLWKTLSSIDLKDPSWLQWIAGEAFAISDSLAFIHDNYAKNPHPDDRERWGRHGDIKTGNFLVYKDPSQPLSKGLIFIADFGLSRFHRQHSRSQVIPRAASPSYRPPEFDLINGTLSRKSDIWSLGAFFLEFVTWYLMGYEAVESTFPALRETLDHDGIYSDLFFQIQEEGDSKTAIVKPEVTQWIKHLHQSGDATLYVHDLLNLVEYEILIIAKESRITATALKEKLEVMHKRCLSDENYLTRNCGCQETAETAAQTREGDQRLENFRRFLTNSVFRKAAE